MLFPKDMRQDTHKICLLLYRLDREYLWEGGLEWAYELEWEWGFWLELVWECELGLVLGHWLELVWEHIGFEYS